MPTTRFKTTIDGIKGGVKNFTVEKATSTIEGWEEYLSKNDQEGIQKVVQDLGKLKQLLHAKDIDGEAVKKVMSKLGKETVAIVGDEQGAEAQHARQLGEALLNASK